MSEQHSCRQKERKTLQLTDTVGQRNNSYMRGAILHSHKEISCRNKQKSLKDRNV